MSKYSEKLKRRQLEKQASPVAVATTERPQQKTSTPNFADGPTHTRHTVLARVKPDCLLRTAQKEDKASPEKDLTRDSFAVTVVCWREGREEGEIELLSFVYTGTNGGSVPAVSYRFPTETAEQKLNETPEGVALNCLRQEVFLHDTDNALEIGPIVRSDHRKSDSARRPGPSPNSVEYLGPAIWHEASITIGLMLQRGIRSHRLSFLSAMEHLIDGDPKRRARYAKELSDWRRL